MSWKDQNSQYCDMYIKRKTVPFRPEEWQRNIPNSYKARCDFAYSRCVALSKIGYQVPKNTCKEYQTSALVIDKTIKRRNAQMGIMPSLPKDLPKLKFGNDFLL